MDGLRLIGLLICLYLLPGIISSSRKTLNSTQVWILNIFLGWTFIGWIVALIMAFSPYKEQ